VLFLDGRRGLIVAQRPPLAFVLCEFGQLGTVDEEVAVLDSRGTIQASDSLLGKVVDCFGQTVQVENDGTITDSTDKGANEPFMRRDIFSPIPQVKDISLINSPFLTGTAMIDALAPIGRGQNMLIVGEHNLGQRQIIVGALRTQIDEMKRNSANGITCIYAITTVDPIERLSVVKSLREAGLLEHIILVTARDHPSLDSAPKDDVACAEAVAVAAAGKFFLSYNIQPYENSSNVIYCIYILSMCFCRSLCLDQKTQLCCLRRQH
jgi:F0F1-type ATP synthase alpha subunit